jgi:predicted Rdx family selenoprotein
VDFPIIDVSKQSVAEFAIGSSKSEALCLVVWYRVVRPLLVLCTWLLAAAYIRWCLVNASQEELSLHAFMPGITGIAAVATSIVLWTFGRLADVTGANRMHRMPISADAPNLMTHQIPSGEAGRCLVAYHDDNGMFSHVVSMLEIERETA